VVLFSYPYGKTSDVRPETTQLAKEAGYTAMFSAYGGHVNWKTSLFDIPRFGIDDDSCGLELLMEIEGLSFGQLRHNLFRQRGSELCLTTTGRWRTKTRGLNESTGYES